METYVPILPVPQQSKTVHHMSPTNKCLWTEVETTVQYQSHILQIQIQIHTQIQMQTHTQIQVSQDTS